MMFGNKIYIYIYIHMIRRWKFEVGEACAYWLAMSVEYQHLP